MGSRKHNSAEARKEDRKITYLAVMRNCPTSPRKMGLVAELIRGKSVYEAMNLLRYSPKHAAKRMEKLLRSAISNYEQKSGERAEDGNLFVSEVHVDGAATLKRFRPAPQGRAYRIRKRSNHVTLMVDKMQQAELSEGGSEAEEIQEAAVVQAPEAATGDTGTDNKNS